MYLLCNIYRSHDKQLFCHLYFKMCYAIPGKVVEIADNHAIVDYFGERRKVRSDLTKVALNDYVYAQGGFIIHKIGKKEALEVLDIWKKVIDSLTTVDKKYSSKPKTTNKRLEKLFTKSLDGSLTRDNLLYLLNLTDEADIGSLCEQANFIRQQKTGNSCCIHGIIEFSNNCVKDCYYCGLRCENEETPRYSMDIDEVIDAADDAVNKNAFKALVLQSGEDPSYTTEALVKMIRGIRERCDVLLFVSVGERSLECYKKMYEAGARGVLLRFETSNPELYKRLHKKSSHVERTRLLESLEDIGYIIATGSLIGLPFQTKKDIVEDILYAKKIGPEMYSFGPFLPNPNTPLADEEPLKLTELLKVLSVLRLAIPEARILVTTAMETLFPDDVKTIILSGAKSMMINVTPLKYRHFYSLYPNKKGMGQETRELIKEKTDILRSLGRAPTDLGVVLDA